MNLIEFKNSIRVEFEDNLPEEFSYIFGNDNDTGEIIIQTNILNDGDSLEPTKYFLEDSPFDISDLEEVLDSVIENYSLSCDEEEYILIFTGLATDSSGELIDVVSDSDCEQADECDEDMESYEED